MSDSAYAPSPTGKRKRYILRLIGALLAFQLLVPLTYYFRDDPYDERFAWRMFSAVRLHTCRTSATETAEDIQRPVDLSKVLHRAWVNHLSRNRRDVVYAFLRRRCQEEGVTQVSVRNDCSTPDGSVLEPQIYERDCATGEVEEPGELIVELRQ